MDPRNYHSVDDLHTLVNSMGDKPTLITTKEAIQQLKEHGIGVSTKYEKKKQRVVTFNASIPAEGTPTCFVIKFADRNFLWENSNKKPKIFYMGNKIWVMLYHPDLKGASLQYYMYKKIIVPEARKKLREIIEDNKNDKKGLQEAVSLSTTMSTAESPVIVNPSSSSSSSSRSSSSNSSSMNHPLWLQELQNRYDQKARKKDEIAAKKEKAEQKKEEKAEKKKAKGEERALLLKKAADEADKIKFVFEDQDSGRDSSTSRPIKRQKKK